MQIQPNIDKYFSKSHFGIQLHSTPVMSPVPVQCKELSFKLAVGRTFVRFEVVNFKEYVYGQLRAKVSTCSHLSISIVDKLFVTYSCRNHLIDRSGVAQKWWDFFCCWYVRCIGNSKRTIICRFAHNTIHCSSIYTRSPSPSTFAIAMVTGAESLKKMSSFMPSPTTA